MATAYKRDFTHMDAAEARSQSPVPLLIGLVGPSGSGKTYSALRIAKGIQSVVGGKIFGVDTEQRRMLHYADKFSFTHVPFAAPFGSLDYLAVLRYCKEQGAGVAIIDSCSHEHDGPGGLLEQHEAELFRMAGEDYRKREAMQMLAWAKPKAARRKLIGAITSELDLPVIFCFRAKTTTKPVKIDGKTKPVDMGFTSIGADEWQFEMGWTGLMLPGSEGVPTWQSEKPGERLAIKMVDQFRWLEQYGQLDEEVGRRCAEWARGNAPSSDPARKWAQTYISKLDGFKSLDELNAFTADKAAKLEELKTARPDLYQQVSDALAQRSSELRPSERQFTSNEAGAANDEPTNERADRVADQVEIGDDW